MIDWEYVQDMVSLMPDGTIVWQSVLLRSVAKKDIDRILVLVEEYITEESDGEEYIDWHGVREEFEWTTPEMPL